MCTSNTSSSPSFSFFPPAAEGETAKGLFRVEVFPEVVEGNDGVGGSEKVGVEGRKDEGGVEDGVDKGEDEGEGEGEGEGLDEGVVGVESQLKLSELDEKGEERGVVVSEVLVILAVLLLLLLLLLVGKGEEGEEEGKEEEVVLLLFLLFVWKGEEKEVAQGDESVMLESASHSSKLAKEEDKEEEEGVFFGVIFIILISVFSVFSVFSPFSPCSFLSLFAFLFFLLLPVAHASFPPPTTSSSSAPPPSSSISGSESHPHSYGFPLSSIKLRRSARSISSISNSSSPFWLIIVDVVWEEVEEEREETGEGEEVAGG